MSFNSDIKIDIPGFTIAAKTFGNPLGKPVRVMLGAPCFLGIFGVGIQAFSLLYSQSRHNNYYKLYFKLNSLRLRDALTGEYHLKMKCRDTPFYLSVILLLMLGFVALLSFASANKYVDNEGILHEPFYLLPIGYFLIMVAVTAIIIRLWQNRRQR